MEIDPRIADRLRKTLLGRIISFEKQINDDFSNMISQCRELGQLGLPGFELLADKIKVHQDLLFKYPPQSDEGRRIRDSTIELCQQLSELFSELADLSAQTSRSEARAIFVDENVEIARTVMNKDG
ncbi:hypothetical protein [Labrenzia sp. PHM005]|uniref:hypothetical protein n=1 Tax=Labrenzia sp. PHM005 TaxID=2590016 RepID=UPI0011402CE0|nr:hypothetical protein [Labrenzia sp. PHM005]QDG76384.1 hypothetical protein FJ695_11155 [Labrenzia sp. PHM005]